MAQLRNVTLGSPRTAEDGCRRYRPIALTFDARNTALEQEVGDDWDPDIKEQWRSNQASIRMGLLGELGTVHGERKIENYMLIGPAPWSIIFRHNQMLAQIRSAFAHGDFYPALLGACGLGERLLNELLNVLRADYLNHPATTRRIRNGDVITHWGTAVEVLRGWGVLSDGLAANFRDLEAQRHRSVHYNEALAAAEREPALQAVQLVQKIIAGLFTPHGGPPTYIRDTPGASFFSLQAEDVPLVKRVFLPHSALLSPAHRMYPNTTPSGYEWIIVDNSDYDPTPLTNEQFAAALPAGIASMHEDLGWTAETLRPAQDVHPPQDSSESPA